MSIHIDRFEEEVHLLIAERGSAYFDSHSVQDLQQTPDGWTATIEGNETYHVRLEGHDEITQWHCTCPFEHGPVCKHVVAVLYAVRNAIHASRSAAAGEIDRWIDQADELTLRRLLKIQVRIHEPVRNAVYHEMKHEN
jgi:uncharacterized Zn finger protein